MARNWEGICELGKNIEYCLNHSAVLFLVKKISYQLMYIQIKYQVYLVFNLDVHQLNTKSTCGMFVMCGEMIIFLMTASNVHALSLISK